MILSDYHHFDGLTWPVGYLTNALAYQGGVAPHTGRPYSEALLMGINGGVCCGYFSFEYAGYDPHLAFLTLYPYDEEPGAVFERLGIGTTPQGTSDAEKAAANVVNALARGKPAIVWADVASLPYSAHEPSDEMRLVMPLLVYGYDRAAGVVHIADRARVPLTTSHEAFASARARLSKTRHRMMTLDAPDADKLPSAVEAGIRACAALYQGDGRPGGAASSWGLAALEKWANLLVNPRDKKSWLKEFAPGARMYAGLTSTYKFLELWNTGGSGARGLYAAFLDEAALILNRPALKDAAALFRACASQWHTLACALLPDAVAPFREARELMDRDYALFLTSGGASVDERRTITARLQALRLQMDSEFPLSESEAAAMRAELREYVLTLLTAERAAVAALRAAMD